MISRNFKNVLVVSLGFLSLFTAYGGLQSLQVGAKASYKQQMQRFHKCSKTTNDFIKESSTTRVNSGVFEEERCSSEV